MFGSKVPRNHISNHFTKSSNSSIRKNPVGIPDDLWYLWYIWYIFKQLRYLRYIWSRELLMIDDPSKTICSMSGIFTYMTGWFILGKCWDSYSSTMVRIWETKNTKKSSKQKSRRTDDPTKNWRSRTDRSHRIHGAGIYANIWGILMGSIPINTIFSGMNIHLPAILMFTRVQGFDTLPNQVWTFTAAAADGTTWTSRASGTSGASGASVAAVRRDGRCFWTF